MEDEDVKESDRIERLVTDKMRAFAKKVAEAINSKFAITVEKCRGIEERVAENARDVREVQETLNGWPKQLQIAVYEPLNDLTTKIGLLQKRVAGMKDDKEGPSESLAKKMDEIERNCLVRLRDHISQVRDDIESRIEEAEAIVRSQTESQEKMRELLSRQQTHQKSVADAVRELQDVRTQGADECSESSKDGRGELIDELQKLRVDVNELKSRPHAVEAKTDGTHNDEEATLTVEIRDYIRECCSNVISTKHDRSERSDLAETTVCTPEKRLIVEDSESVITPRTLFDVDSDSAIKLAREGFGTPDVERELGRILGSETKSRRTANSSKSMTPDVEKFVGRILEQSEDDDGREESDQNDEKSHGGRNAVDVVRGHERRVLTSLDELRRQMNEVKAHQESLREQFNQHRLSLTPDRRSSDLNAPIALECSEIACEFEEKLRRNTERYDAEWSELNDMIRRSRDIAGAERERLEHCVQNVHDDLSKRAVEISEESILRSVASEEMAAREMKRSREEYDARLKSMQEFHMEHATALDHRCTEWSKSVSKTLQSYHKRRDKSMSAVKEHIAASKLQSDAIESRVRDVVVKNVEDVLEKESRRHSHSIQQMRLAQEGIVRKISSSQIGQEQYVEGKVQRLETFASELVEREHGAITSRLERSNQAWESTLADMRSTEQDTKSAIKSLMDSKSTNQTAFREELERKLQEAMGRLDEVRRAQQRQDTKSKLENVETRLSSCAAEVDALRTFQSQECERQKSDTTRLRDALLQKHVELSERLTQQGLRGEAAIQTLRGDVYDRLTSMKAQARSWIDDFVDVEESHLCAQVSTISNDLGVLRADMSRLSLRVDTHHQKTAHEASSLRARHVDVVDALVRTKRCQSEMKQTTVRCLAIEDTLSRLRSRLAATEKRIPEMRDQLVRTADRFHQNVARLSEDIGTVSCSVADLKMGFDGLARPPLDPLVVKDPHLL